jgi:hypothetical protein
MQTILMQTSWEMNLEEANLKGIKLNGANLQGTNLQWALFQRFISEIPFAFEIQPVITLVTRKFPVKGVDI